MTCKGKEVPPATPSPEILAEGSRWGEAGGLQGERGRAQGGAGEDCHPLAIGWCEAQNCHRRKAQELSLGSCCLEAGAQGTDVCIFQARRLHRGQKANATTSWQMLLAPRPAPLVHEWATCHPSTCLCHCTQELSLPTHILLVHPGRRQEVWKVKE